MKALLSHYTLETAIQLALEAGVDLFTFGNNIIYEPDIAIRTIALIRKFVQ